MGADPYQAILGNFQGPAQSLGFMPNPYASPAQQMMDAQRFMSLSKAIMDQVMGSNNAWNRTSPGNPTQAMPFGLRNMFNAFGGLANGPGSLLMPGGSQGMLNQGGYQAGPLGTNMSPLLQWYLGQMGKTPEPTPSDITRAGAGIPSGPGTVNAPSPGGTATPSQSPNAPGGGPQMQGSTTGGPTANDVQGPTVPGLSGANDIARQIPLIGGYVSGAENALGDITGRTSPNGPGPSGDVPVLSGANDILRGLVPGLGAAGDVVRNVFGGGGQQQGGGQPGTSPGGNVTVNTSGQPMPRTMAILAQRFGINSVPQGVDPNDFLDNIVSRILGGQ